MFDKWANLFSSYRNTISHIFRQLKSLRQKLIKIVEIQRGKDVKKIANKKVRQTTC